MSAAALQYDDVYILHDASGGFFFEYLGGKVLRTLTNTILLLFLVHTFAEAGLSGMKIREEHLKFEQKGSFVYNLLAGIEVIRKFKFSV